MLLESILILVRGNSFSFIDMNSNRSFFCLIIFILVMNIFLVVNKYSLRTFQNLYVIPYMSKETIIFWAFKDWFLWYVVSFCFRELSNLLLNISSHHFLIGCWAKSLFSSFRFIIFSILSKPSLALYLFWMLEWHILVSVSTTLFSLSYTFPIYCLWSWSLLMLTNWSFSLILTSIWIDTWFRSVFLIGSYWSWDLFYCLDCL